jgi:SAM-dependent MidA family methyltransferase
MACAESHLSVARVIEEEISLLGPIPFERFMELALYHPDGGYYARVRHTQIGRRGDFWTSPSLGPLFGRLLALQFTEVWELLGKPHPFYLVEQGAHKGELAADILETIAEVSPAFWSAARYRIIEPKEPWRTVQAETCSQRGVSDRVEWSPSLKEGEPIAQGIFFCNELLDSFPVHRVLYDGREWKEFYVACREGRFDWLLGPLSTPVLIRHLEELPLPRILNYTTEVNLRARGWLYEVSQGFRQALFFLIDYGYNTPEYYSPFRKTGTLAAYRSHRRCEDLLEAPGEQDLSAHVDFGTLARWGEELGHQTLGWADQGPFLVGVASKYLGQKDFLLDLPRSARVFHMLVHPEGFGRTFRVLIQAKGVATALPLSCLRFARPRPEDG